MNKNMEVSVYKTFRTRGKRPLRNLSLADKVRAIQRIHDGETKASVSRDLGVPESTLRGWCKNESKLRFMSSQSQLLEGLATTLPEKPTDNIEAPTNYINMNFINNENTSYKIPEPKRNTQSFSKFLEPYVDINGFTGNMKNWSPPFIETSNSSSREAFMSDEFANQIKMEQSETEIENCENFGENSGVLIPKVSLRDIMSDKMGDNSTLQQWCQMFMSSLNFMTQAAIAADLKFETFTSSLTTEQDATSVYSFHYGGKRVYDDPYSELRNIYEVKEPDDSTNDCFYADDEDQPQDLSIKSLKP